MNFSKVAKFKIICVPMMLSIQIAKFKPKQEPFCQILMLAKVTLYSRLISIDGGEGDVCIT